MLFFIFAIVFRSPHVKHMPTNRMPETNSRPQRERERQKKKRFHCNWFSHKREEMPSSFFQSSKCMKRIVCDDWLRMLCLVTIDLFLYSSFLSTCHSSALNRRWSTSWCASKMKKTTTSTEEKSGDHLPLDNEVWRKISWHATHALSIMN